MLSFSTEDAVNRRSWKDNDAPWERVIDGSRSALNSVVGMSGQLKTGARIGAGILVLGTCPWPMVHDL